MAEEIRRPSRYIPGALLLGTGTVIIAYLLMNLAYFGSVPLSQLEGERWRKSPHGPSSELEAVPSSRA